MRHCHRNTALVPKYHLIVFLGSPYFESFGQVHRLSSMCRWTRKTKLVETSNKFASTLSNCSKVKLFSVRCESFDSLPRPVQTRMFVIQEAVAVQAWRQTLQVGFLNQGSLENNSRFLSLRLAQYLLMGFLDTQSWRITSSIFLVILQLKILKYSNLA